ncbi:MAG TPA: hypothetical protein VGC13_04450 [Longimicrobium sp.]|jgi:hypothetical protein|uniref:hypothetical protein n=1 Tax=Longimicrobium sp. TaxID=2029185 RepID=UPI002EDAC025
MDQVSSQHADFGWLHFVARSGDEGSRWAEHYRQFEALEQLSTRSLLLLRRGDVLRGYELLEELGEAIRTVVSADPSIRSVLERWYYGVLGYYFYCIDRSDEAEDAMVQAHRAVTAAIGTRLFLLPLANHCHEFRLHRARIARNRLRWEQMQVHVEEARAMMAGVVPFCVLNDGSPVRIAEVCAFYAAIPSLTDAERDSLAGLLNDEVRLRGFEQFVNSMYRVPGFVIPYP